MKTVLCDASPLIFLAKVNRLGLIDTVLSGDIAVLNCVKEELSAGDVAPVESGRLADFLDSVRVIDYENSDYPSKALSQCDRSTLNWALENRPDWLVADERLLRRIAIDAGLSVIGTLGILFETTRKNVLSKSELRTCIDDLVGNHGFRISISLYQHVLTEIESI